jgi:hypothetical protein
MGLVSLGDEFCARTDRALAGIPGVYKLVDDILVFGETHVELLHRIRLVFERCLGWGITLSKKKYQFGPVVQFSGYVVSEEGTRQDPKLVEAISKFPAPKDVTNLLLVNRFNDSNPDLKHAMASWQGLLKKSIVYRWGDVHEAALTKVKEIITNPVGPILKHFDSTLPIRVLTDSSRTGIGFCLVQTEVGSKILLLIMAGSRFLSPAEKNYAVVELAIQWAIEKCRLYLAGTDFTVITNHQPLLGILNRKNLDAINNVRIQRLMAKLLGYSFRVEWVPGKNHHIANSLSRNPVFAAPDHKDIIIHQGTEVIMDEALAEMSDVARADKDYQEVVTAVRSGLYDGKKIKNLRRSHPALQYRGQWDYMAVEDVFLTFHGRLVVPEAA